MFTIRFLLAVVSFSAFAHNSGQLPCEAYLFGQGLNARQRHMALAAELVKLKGPEFQAVHRADPSLEIRRISGANLARLLGELEARWPLNSSRSPELERLQAMAEELEFVPLKTLRGYPTGEVLPEEDFYSELTGGADTVGFTWTATRKHAPLHNLNGHVHLDSVTLSRTFSDGFADEFGVVLPEFFDARALIQFFRAHDRRPFEDLRKLNRWSLPSSAWDQFGFLNFLKEPGSEEVFAQNIYQRLGPLRQALHRFLLTPEDARAFFKAAFVHSLYNAVTKNGRTMPSIEEDWRRMGGSGDLFSATLRELGWGGVSMRIPRNVPASRVGIIRAEETRMLAAPDHSRSAQPRRLDYKNMPDGLPLNLR